MLSADLAAIDSREWEVSKLTAKSELRILGIDPGLNKTGYGVISFANNRFTRIDSGVIRVPAGNLSDRLGYIYSQMGKVIEKNSPQVSIIEKTFLNTNAQSSLLLSHARGAAMCAAATHNIDCIEFSTREIKKSVTGYGAATKEQIKEMVHRLLADDKKFAEDEADALAAAICYANSKVIMALTPTPTRLGTSGTATARRGGSAGRARGQWTKKYGGGN